MKRRLDEKILKKLMGDNLWIHKIKQDCNDQNVFCAIRDDSVGFYYKGGLLFKFDNSGFKTHIKYASVILASGKDYLTECELKDYKLVSDFETNSNYRRIKENCSNYSGIEASGVSDLYHKHSYLSDSNVVVLDIEVSFESSDEGRTQDRIDILLYKKDTLQFAEAKHYSNSELWSNRSPKAIKQINRYEKQIANRKAEILSEYSEYVRTINGIFNKTLSDPKHIEDKVILLIFGFDNDQKKGRLKKLITKNPVYSGIKIYSKGNIKNVVTENLWNAKVL